MAAQPRYQIRSPQGAVTAPSGTGAAAGGFYDDLEAAISACADLNALQDPSFQYVIVPVIHPTA